jgi:hypothetical protein
MLVVKMDLEGMVCKRKSFSVSCDKEAIAILDQGEVTFPTRYQRLRYLSLGHPLGPNTCPIDVNTCFCGKAIALQRADRCIADAL